MENKEKPTKKDLLKEIKKKTIFVNDKVKITKNASN